MKEVQFISVISYGYCMSCILRTAGRRRLANSSHSADSTIPVPVLHSFGCSGSEDSLSDCDYLGANTSLNCQYVYRDYDTECIPGT